MVDKHHIVVEFLIGSAARKCPQTCLVTIMVGQYGGYQIHILPIWGERKQQMPILPKKDETAAHGLCHCEEPVVQVL